MSSTPINTVFLGDAGHGKSALIGRLLYDLRHVPEAIVEYLKSVAAQVGDASYYLSFIVDTRLDERRRKHTIETSSWKPVSIGGRLIKLINVPGVLTWINNTIAGASQADAAVVVVDAADAATRGIASLKGLREHLILARAFDIRSLIAAINKMDLIEFDSQRFQQVCEALKQLLTELGFEAEQVPIIPVSALYGDNVVQRSDRCPWYDGPTLAEALSSLPQPQRYTDAPFRLPIHRYFEKGNVMAGVVASGRLTVGDEVVVAPSGGRGSVRSIEAWGKRLDSAGAGEDIGVQVRGIARYQIKRGYVLSHPDNPPPVAETLVARVCILNPPGLWKGFCPLLYTHQAYTTCRVEAVLNRIDPHTGQVVEENPSQLSPRETGDVVLKPLTPPQKGLVIEASDQNPPLSRLALRTSIGSGGETVTLAAGYCLKVTPLST